MVRVDQAIIARYKRDGAVFEILVDCDKALAYREGKVRSLDDVLATKEVFSDVKKGLRAAESEMRRVFKAVDPLVVADFIVKKGEIQLTTEHRNKLRDEKRRQIIEFIHRNAIDVKTGLPHPLTRIAAAMDQAKVKIDESQPVEAQVQEVVARLRSLLPIRFEVREVEVIIPSQYSAYSFTSLKRLTKVLKEEWLGDGRLRAVVEIPAGIQEEVEAELNKITKGDVELKILSKR